MHLAYGRKSGVQELNIDEYENFRFFVGRIRGWVARSLIPYY